MIIETETKNTIEVKDACTECDDKIIFINNRENDQQAMLILNPKEVLYLISYLSHILAK